MNIYISISLEECEKVKFYLKIIATAKNVGLQILLHDNDRESGLWKFGTST
jgi:hypothetical protein